MKFVSSLLVLDPGRFPTNVSANHGDVIRLQATMIREPECLPATASARTTIVFECRQKHRRKSARAGWRSPPGNFDANSSFVTHLVQNVVDELGNLFNSCSLCEQIKCLMGVLQCASVARFRSSYLQGSEVRPLRQAYSFSGHSELLT